MQTWQVTCLPYTVESLLSPLQPILSPSGTTCQPQPNHDKPVWFLLHLSRKPVKGESLWVVKGERNTGVEAPAQQRCLYSANTSETVAITEISPIWGHQPGTKRNLLNTPDPEQKLIEFPNNRELIKLKHGLPWSDYVSLEKPLVLATVSGDDS